MAACCRRTDGRPKHGRTGSQCVTDGRTDWLTYVHIGVRAGGRRRRRGQNKQFGHYRTQRSWLGERDGRTGFLIEAKEGARALTHAAGHAVVGWLV